MEQSKFIYQRKDLPKSFERLGYILFFIGIITGGLSYLIDPIRASFNYLIMYVFLLSLGLGSLFLIAIEYLTGADWSVQLRRISEFLASVILVLFVLVLPLLFNLNNIFTWLNKSVIESDKILKGKSAYLNSTFFIIRVFFCLLLWGLFYTLLTRNSKLQDTTKDNKLTKKNIIISAVFIPVFAITLTIAAVDWLMSLDAHWYSTIFGVYFFSGSVVAALAAVTYSAIKLKEKGYLHPKFLDEHLYSLGTLLFVFINFWAYIAFSQYMLIWYADLPEETEWFLHRWHDGWAVISLLLIFAHFIIPYAMLLSQPSKMDPKRLKFITIWILAAHFIDLFWIIMPSINGAIFSWMDLTFPFAAVGVIILVFAFKAKHNNLIPIGDPKLEKSINIRL
jgi:hypothetical protein